MQQLSFCTILFTPHPGKQCSIGSLTMQIGLNTAIAEKRLCLCSIRATCFQPMSQRSSWSMLVAAADLRFRSIADAAPMRILYSSSFNVSLTCSTMDCDQSPGDHRSIEPIPVDHLPGSCSVGMHNTCERFRQATNEQTKHYGQCWSLL